MLKWKRIFLLCVYALHLGLCGYKGLMIDTGHEISVDIIAMADSSSFLNNFNHRWDCEFPSILPQHNANDAIDESRS